MTRNTRWIGMTVIALAAILSACSNPVGTDRDAEGLNNTNVTVTPITEDVPGFWVGAQPLSESVITFLWTTVAGATRYEVLYMPAPGYGWQRVQVGADTPNLDLEGLQSNTKYYFRVRALGAGERELLAISPVDSVTTLGAALPEPPAAPSDLFASVNATTSVSIIFKDNSDNEEGFEIFYLDITAYDFRWHKGPILAANDETASQLVAAEIEGLEPGHRYYVRVRAINSGGVSKFSNVDDGVTQEEEDITRHDGERLDLEA